MNVDDAHASPITDILYLERNGTKIVFTSCGEEIRAYSLSDKAERQVSIPTKPVYCKKMIAASLDFIVCGMSDGSYLGWDLATNQQNPCPGHE